MSEETRPPEEAAEEGADKAAAADKEKDKAKGKDKGKSKDKGKEKEKDKEKEKAAAKPNPLAGLPLVLIGVVAGGFVLGAALGSLLLAPQVNRMRHAATVAALADPHHKKDKKDGKDKKDKKEGKKGETGKTPVFKLDNIIVNPAGSQGQRFLMCSVAIESEDPKALDVLREQDIMLRDRVISLLAKQSLDRLTADSARDSLRAELLAVIKPALGPDGQDTELKIYLPQFVVQ